MRMLLIRGVRLLAIEGMMAFGAATIFAAEPLLFKNKVPWPEVKGRFDHFAADTNTHRIFVAALGNNTVEVIDGVAAKRRHSITGQHKPCGIAFIAETKRLFVANGGDGTIKVYDSESYRLVKSITGLDDADNVRFDAKAGLLYVGHGDGGLSAVDPAKLEVVASIKLKAHPESFQLEQTSPRIFVNVPEAKHIAVVDREQRKVITTWPLEKFQANFPMALDETSRRLFIGCRRPARLVVLDTESGKPVSDLAISGDTDDLFYDARRRRLYASCGAGFVDVIEQTSSDNYRRVGSIPTSPGARTSFFSEALNLFFVAVPERGGGQAELRIFQPE